MKLQNICGRLNRFDTRLSIIEFFEMHVFLEKWLIIPLFPSESSFTWFHWEERVNIKENRPKNTVQKVKRLFFGYY